MNRKSGSTETAQLLRVVTAVVVVAALYVGRAVFIPLALALLLSLLLAPVMDFLGRVRVPRLMAICLVVVALCALAGGFGWKASTEFTDSANQLPIYKETLEGKIKVLSGLRSSNFSKVSNAISDLERELTKSGPPEQDRLRKAPTPGSSIARPMAVEVVPPSDTLASLETILGPMGALGMVGVFTIFILIGREDLRNRFIHLASGGRLTVMTQALDEAAKRIQRYLFLQSAVNVGFGAIVGIVLYLIGIPDAWLWGLFAVILRFLPYVGAPLAAFIPILLSLAIFPGWDHTWGTIAFFFVLELSVANFIEPFLYGAHVGLSALAILVAAVFWTLIWGFPGLILSTPLTVTLVVMGRYVPSLNFLRILLGDQPEISRSSLYYQRLLALDQNEARQVLEQYLKEKPLTELYSEVLIPAMSLVEQDRHRNELDEATQSFIMQSTRELIEELDEVPVEDTVTTGESLPIPRPLDVLCIPARDEADEIVALLLSQLLQRNGFSSQILPLGPTSDVWSAVTDMNPELVCISALPPFAIDHARNLYQKLRSKSPKLDIVICLWHFEGDLEKAARRLKVLGGHGLKVSLNDVVEHVAAKIRPPVVELKELDEIPMLDSSPEVARSAKNAIAS
jgi:predicted PurR-regulated permease PerM/methanogenic corrinoid protein MtbC1